MSRTRLSARSGLPAVFGFAERVPLRLDGLNDWGQQRQPQGEAVCSGAEVECGVNLRRKIVIRITTRILGQKIVDEFTLEQRSAQRGQQQAVLGKIGMLKFPL
jgi:hypothetical protein